MRTPGTQGSRDALNWGKVINGPLGGRNVSQAHRSRSDSDSPVDHGDKLFIFAIRPVLSSKGCLHLRHQDGRDNACQSGVSKSRGKKPPRCEGYARQALDLRHDKVADTSGSGWVDYMWPKPGESVSTQKSTYVSRARLERLQQAYAASSTNRSRHASCRSIQTSRSRTRPPARGGARPDKCCWRDQAQSTRAGEVHPLATREKHAERKEFEVDGPLQLNRPRRIGSRSPIGGCATVLMVRFPSRMVQESALDSGASLSWASVIPAR